MTSGYDIMKAADSKSSVRLHTRNNYKVYIKLKKITDNQQKYCNSTMEQQMSEDRKPNSLRGCTIGILMDYNNLWILMDYI